MTSIHERIGDLIEVAKIYAEDGAFRTAAARLREAADMLDAHAAATDDLADLEARAPVFNTSGDRYPKTAEDRAFLESKGWRTRKDGSMFKSRDPIVQPARLDDAFKKLTKW